MLDKASIKRIAQQYPVSPLERLLFSHDFHKPLVGRGYLKKKEFMEIVRWKAARQQPNAKKSDESTLRDITTAAFSETDPCVAVDMLDGLRGVGVRMASAILAVFAPDVRTVMDIRAWQSLVTGGYVESPRRTKLQTHLDKAETYGFYLKKCSALAKRVGVNLRTLDRCLWMLRGRTPEKFWRDVGRGEAL